MNEQQLQALAAQHGGLAGRSIDPQTQWIEQDDPLGGKTKKPNPDPHWVIAFNDGTKITVQPGRGGDGQPDGSYNVSDWGNLAPTKPSGTDQPKSDFWVDPTSHQPYQIVDNPDGSKGLRPISGNVPGAPTAHQTPQGMVVWGPTGDDPTPHWSLIPGTGQTQPSPTLHNAGNTVLQQGPDGTIRPVYVDQAGIAKDQAAVEAERERIRIAQQQANNAARQGDVQGFNSWYANYVNAAQLDETTRQNQFKIDTTLNYDMPRQQVADENAALTSRFQAANTIGQYETNRFNAGRGAAQDRWLGYMQSLPYRASPQFVQEYSQRAAQEAQGVPIGERTAYSPAALTISGPSMDAQRQAGYAEAGVTGGLPTFDQVLAKAPAFAAMDPAALKKYNDMLMFAYQPPPRSAA